MKYLVTGGLGFIGSNLIKKLMKKKNNIILNIDSISYCSMPESLEIFKNNLNYKFKKINICNYKKLNEEINNFNPDIIFHLAAHSHVDNSIKAPDHFIKNNIIGSYNMFKSALNIYKKNKKFKMINVSTDEVFGSLKLNQQIFNEENTIKPNSPYSASKASADVIGRSFHKTFNLPLITSNCSNNFGPWQYPEKLIPKSIKSMILGNKIEIYGNGKNIRDWLYVEDHVDALIFLSKFGIIGETYNIGSKNEISNNDLIKNICAIFDNLTKNKNSSYSLLHYVTDRKGHDFRYAIDNSKILKLGFNFTNSFHERLFDTVQWYINHKSWLIKKKV